MDRYVTSRLRQWLCGKHKVSTAGTTRFPDQYLYEDWDWCGSSPLDTQPPVGESMKDT